MTDKHEVLRQLFTDDNDINANELFDILSPFIKINKTSKNIIFLDAWHKEPLKNKITLFLLGKKALFLLGEIETDHTRSTDIVTETGLSKGSVNPTLMLLKGKKGNSLISSDEAGYYITGHQVSTIKIKNILNNHEKDN